MEPKIRELFAALLQVQPEEIRDESDPDTLSSWDSMQHLMLVAGFEEEFGVEVEPEEAADMYSNFSTFKRIVLDKLNAARA